MNLAVQGTRAVLGIAVLASGQRGHAAVRTPPSVESRISRSRVTACWPPIRAQAFARAMRCRRFASPGNVPERASAAEIVGKAALAPAASAVSAARVVSRCPAADTTGPQTASSGVAPAATSAARRTVTSASDKRLRTTRASCGRRAAAQISAAATRAAGSSDSKSCCSCASARTASGAPGSRSKAAIAAVSAGPPRPRKPIRKGAAAAPRREAIASTPAARTSGWCSVSRLPATIAAIRAWLFGSEATAGAPSDARLEFSRRPIRAAAWRASARTSGTG